MIASNAIICCDERVSENMSRPFPKMYGSSRWQRRSKLQLKQFPMCAECERQGRTFEATISHHLQDHRGDSHSFYYGPLESLCFQCHQEEHGHRMRSFRQEIGIDGWPLPASSRNARS